MKTLSSVFNTQADFSSFGLVISSEIFSHDEVNLMNSDTQELYHKDQKQWLMQVARGNASALFFDLSDPTGRSKAIRKAVSYLGRRPEITETLGANPTITAVQLRLTPANPVSYIPWHVDIELHSEARVKAMVYLTNVHVNSGAFAYVPGSHRPDSPALWAPKNKSQMQGHCLLTGPPGTVIFFDPKGWHTMMANRSGVSRHALIVEFAETH